MILVLLDVLTLFSQTVHLKGEASAWTYLRETSLSESEFAVRYIPTLSIFHEIHPEFRVDVEASIRALGIGTFGSPDRFVDDAEFKAYRLWLRFSRPQFELRGGLQKINFGSALLLRPLMWFDRIDPRDPLQITDGVYALLGRYYFINNANIWLWGLYGNDEVKGWEVIPSDDQSIEYGGRFQYPIGTGEFALTYHRRKADLGNSPLSVIAPTETIITEQRLALDGKWDFEIGIWFEAALVAQNSDALPIRHRNFLTLGADYTLPLGSGLRTLGEHLFLSLSRDAFGTDETFNFSALLLDYNFGLLDRFTTIVFYDWDSKQFSRYASWGRLYDRWSFYFNVFWNPEQTNLIAFQQDSMRSLGRGTGLQLMVAFNH